MSDLDYSKWNNIEISDDEDDTHPNIDTPSLFRWRHKARIERMEEQKLKEQQLRADTKKYEQKLEQITKKIENSNEENRHDSEEQLKQLLLEGKEIEKRKEELEKEKKKAPLNVDTIAKEKTSRTMFNTPPEYKPEDLTDEEKGVNLEKFRKQHMSLVKKFGVLRRSRESREFFSEHPFMMCEETCNLLVLWCMDLAIDEKFDLLDHVAHQVIVLQFILELARQMKRDPRSCADPFFQRYDNMTNDANLEIYKKSFDEELEAFKCRIRKRAIEKIKEAQEEVTEERILQKGEMLGPGGLDPTEVFETLPPELRKCFETRDVEMLKNVISSMNPEDAEYHMKRCVDSGLWTLDDNSSD